MINLERLGKNIKKERTRLGYTQQDLGAMIEKHFTFVGHIERGTKSPGLQTLVDICRALKASLNTIMRGV